MAEAQPPVSDGEEDLPKPLENTVAESAPPANSAAAEPLEQAAAPEPVEQAAAPAAAEPSTGAVADAMAPAAEPAESPADGSPEAAISDEQKAIDDLLKQATFEDPSSVVQDLPQTNNLDLPNFSQVTQEAQISSLDLLRDVDLNVKIELGRSHMLVEDVLKLGEGSVVELDKLAGDPVDVFVNDRLVARGEVLVLNDNFCVRVNEIVAGVKEEGL